MIHINRLNNLIQVVAALFVLLFLYTAIEKLRSPGQFEQMIHQSPLLRNFSRQLAWFIPGIEILIVLLLIIPSTRSSGLVLSVGLMTVFTLYIAYMLLSDSKLPCTCGGVLQSMSWRTHLFFNSGFVVAGIWGLILSRKYKRLIAINRSSRTPV